VTAGSAGRVGTPSAGARSSEARGVSAPPDDATWQAALARRPGDAITRVAQYGMAAHGAFCAPGSSPAPGRPGNASGICCTPRAIAGHDAFGAPGGPFPGFAGQDGFFAPRDSSELSVVPMRLPNDLAAQFRGALTAKVRALEQLVPRTFSIGTGSASGSISKEAEVGGFSADAASPPSILIARTFSILGGFVPAWVALLALVE